MTETIIIRNLTSKDNGQTDIILNFTQIKKNPENITYEKKTFFLILLIGCYIFNNSYQTYYKYNISLTTD